MRNKQASLAPPTLASKRYVIFVNIIIYFNIFEVRVVYWLHLNCGNILAMQISWDMCALLDHLNSPSAWAMNWETQLSHCVLNTQTLVTAVRCPRGEWHVSVNHNRCSVFSELCRSGLPTWTGTWKDFVFKDCPLGWGSRLYSFRVIPFLSDNYTTYCLSWSGCNVVRSLCWSTWIQISPLISNSVW